MKKSKAVFAWCPKDALGKYWVFAMEHTKRRVAKRLKETGVSAFTHTIVKMKIEEVPPQRGLRRIKKEKTK